MIIGIFALQGAFIEHKNILDIKSILIKYYLLSFLYLLQHYDITQ
jgi:glutamine amidotransferase PdxT